MIFLSMTKHYIKHWRKYRDITQGQLADRMEDKPGERLMSHVTVSFIENGKQSPTLEQLGAFAEALDVSVNDLIGTDPTKDGEVVDLLKLIDDANRDRVIAILKAAVA